MTAYTPQLVAEMSENYGATTFGVTGTAITPNSSGDSFQLIGDTLNLVFVTTGTSITVTADSVDLSNFGQDQNITCVLAATAVTFAAFDANVSRWKQTSGNVGYVNLTYTAITGLTIYATYSAT
jgi:hypothetical protein